ncbi:MAG TPA: MFS transporter [Caulobacterales bacterium]|nr:MFS transporter [Caulobacterales bacterium]
MTDAFNFSGRRSTWAFGVGWVLVTIGVILHLPMYWMGRFNHFVLVGMPMDAGMYLGMLAIVVGVGIAGYGLLPKPEALSHAHDPIERLTPPEDAPLTREHWIVMGVLTVALVIDIMKPASLGFVTPGMRTEYAVNGATVSILPFGALAGTATGSFVWGALADLYGRRAAILLSAVMFVGTSICGAMPDFWWNVGMCFLMGLSAGGMLPVAYALLAEIMPTKHRGWSLVLVGGMGAVGGYFAASGLSQLLQPYWGWRIMWFLNLPTGLIIILMARMLPESARFLQHMGRGAEARAALARFGAVVVASRPQADTDDHSHLPPIEQNHLGITLALTLAALAWGLVNFGLLLWLPITLTSEGLSIGAASEMIRNSSLIAAPVVLVCTWLYSRWSTRGSLMAMIAVITVGLVAVLLRTTGIPGFTSPLLFTSLLIIGATGAISVLLPYTAECYPLRIRGRASGWIAGCSKGGGLLAQAVSVFIGIPPLGAAALAIGSIGLAAMALIARFGAETRGRDLRELDGLMPTRAESP